MTRHRPWFRPSDSRRHRVGRPCRYRIRLGAVSALAATMLAGSAGAVEWTVVSLEPGRPPQVLNETKLGALSPGMPVWMWSEKCAPQRLTAPLPKPIPCIEQVQFEVRVLNRERHPLPGVEVLAASEAMRRELPDRLLPVTITTEKGLARVNLPQGSGGWVRCASIAAATPWRAARDDLMLVGLPGHPVNLEIRETDGTHDVVRLELSQRAMQRMEDWPDSWDIGTAGRLIMPPYPSSLPVVVTIWGETSTPQRFEAAVSELPFRVDLKPGSTIGGKVFNLEGQAIANASIAAAFNLPGTTRGLVRRTTTDDEGVFYLSGFPPGVAMLTAEAPGRVPLRREIRFQRNESEKVSLVLERARQVILQVQERSGEPVVHAAAEIIPGLRVGISDKTGKLVLATAPAASFAAAIRASGFLPAQVEVPEGVSKPILVTLQRAAGIRAVFRFDDSGEPAGPGRIDWASQNRIEEPTSLPASGVLEENDRTPGRWNLTVYPEGGVPARFEDLVLRGGETLDLGEIAVDRGLAIAGTVFDDTTGMPVEGARVRVLLADANRGSRMAAFMEQWEEALADVEGTYRIEGLEPERYPVLVEAADHAPRLIEGVELTEDLPAGTLTMDPVWLGPPHGLLVQCEPALRCGDSASLLLGSAINDWAHVAVALNKGEARVYPVPAGNFNLRLTERGFLVTQREVSISRNRENTVIEISLSGSKVEGSVLLGNDRASDGTVSFQPGGGGAGIPEVIVNTGFPGQSVPQQAVLTDRGRTLLTQVGTDGSFVLHDVPPGDYTATYTNVEGWLSSPQDVTVQETDETIIVLRLQGGAIVGSVRTNENRPPTGASVSVEFTSGAAATAPCGPGGEFTIGGLPPGRAVIRARALEGSAEQQIVIEDDETTRVEIELSPPDTTLTVTVLSPDGTRANGAFVAAMGTGGIEVQQAKTDGRALFTSKWIGASEVRLGAYWPGRSFVFQRVRPPGQTAPEVTLVLPAEPGALEVQIEGAMRALGVTSPEGFPVERILPFLGVVPAAGSQAPLVLNGLPPGNYHVTIPGNQSLTVQVKPGERTVIGPLEG